MKKQSALCLIVLTLTACAVPPPPATLTPLPPAATDTSIPTIPPTSGTEVIVTATAVTLPPQLTPENTTSAPPAATSTALPPVTGIYNPYSVILVGEGDVLNIRSGAGVGNAIVGALQPSAVGVNRTGPASSAGGDRWVEIQNPGGSTGWVNANFLTEQIASSTFCSDARVSELLNNLKTALMNSNGELLSSLVSPVHGLDLRLWRYGTVANYSLEEASWVFESEYVVSWGPAPGSGEETSGTFSNQPLPKLQEVFGSNYTLHCNDTLDLATFTIAPWPPE